ncbi:hypothetical protein CI603_00760 [Bifidobacterium sp. wkB338]|nr:hypothetical protein CI603_00760 [Bifidobacterium sp. wkB338]
MDYAEMKQIMFSTKDNEPKDMDPSDQRIETIASIPLIDYENNEVPAIKPARLQAASRKTSSGRINHSFPAPTKVRLGEGWLALMRSDCLSSFLC